MRRATRRAKLSSRSCARRCRVELLEFYDTETTTETQTMAYNITPSSPLLDVVVVVAQFIGQI